MNEVKLVFIILHYLNIEDTFETINSIVKNIDTLSYRIVIVDNASPDNSAQKLLSTYRENPNITVLLSKSNLGFSGGNNLGIKYARDTWDFSFLILSNNDIYLYDKAFLEKIEAEYRYSNFAVLGPMIMTAQGRCDSNPICDKPYTKEACLNEIRLYKKHLRMGEMGIYSIWRKYDYYMNKLFSGRASKNSPVVKDKTPGIFMQRRENVVLHGCFMIFSKNYFQVFQGLDARTFMYSEENILFQHCRSKNLLMVYNPDIAIYHKEGASVNKVASNGVKAKLFRYKTKIAAHEAYIDLLDELGIEE